MAKNLHPPEKLLLTGNLKENYRKFKQQFQIYLTAAGISNSEEEVKCATLLHVIGPDAIEIFNTFRWNQEGDTPGDDKKLDKDCQSLKNTAAQRVTLLTRDISSTHGIRMMENQLIHTSQNSGFCQNRVNLEI